MKKLMIAAAAALCATVGFSDGIESSNVVGYYSENAPQAKFMLGAASLEAIDGGIKLNAFKGLTPVAIDWEGDPTTFWKTAPQLQIWNGTGYDLTYYVSNAWYDNGTEEGDYKEGWCDGDGLLREGYSIPVGYGFWVKATSGACTLNFNNPIK